MKAITIREAQHNLAKVLKEVESGGQVEILRRKIPVARLVPVRSPSGDAGLIDWGDHRERMVSLWGGKPVTGVGDVLDDLRGER